MKKCTKCNIEKDYSFFHKNTKNKDKHHYNCKACRKEESLIQYGLTLADYNEMFEAQNRCCKICKGTVPRGTATDNRFYVDHCHSTGRVRGLLCNDCNHGLGKFYDNVEFLYAAINYLEGDIDDSSNT